MNAKTLILAAATAGAAVVTLVVLNLVAPISHAEAAPAATVSAEQVFSASIDESAQGAANTVTEVALAQTDAPAQASEPAAASKPAEAPVAAKGGSCAEGVPAKGGSKPLVVAAASETVAPTPAPTAEAAASPAAAPTEVAQADTAPVEAPVQTAPVEPAAAEPAPVEAAPAEAAPAAMDATAPSTPASGGGACSTGIAASGEAPVVVMASGAPDGAGSAAQPAAPAPKAARAPKPVAVAAADTATAAAPKSAPASKPKSPSAGKAASSSKKAPKEVKTAWWPAKADGKLNITYAGEASFTKAIVLLLDGTFDSPESANKNVVVKTKGGAPVKGQWLVATNKQMLLFNVAPGLYTVEVGAGLTDKGGRTLAAAASGPVFVP